MPVRLFVGNLPYDVTETDLRDFFSAVGPLTSVIIPVDRETGKRRGFAFIEFSDPAQAEEANRRLNNQPFKGRNITINEARARESRPDSGHGTRPGYPMRPAGIGSMPHRGFTPKPSPGSPEFAPDTMDNGRAARAERRSRNFGTDAKPARKRKGFYGPRTEMGKKRGPMRERVGGQFFGGYEDDTYDAYEDGRELSSVRGYRDSDEEDAV